nr:metallophosphoesterase [uncultured Anaeromusa sp.]
MPEYIHVLHISDLHFGAEANEKLNKTAIAKRKNTLDDFINTLADFEPNWYPDVVVISGDIGWKGQEADYKQAEEWIEVLLQKLRLSPENLIICPGNHDLDRKWTLGTKYPSGSSEADEWLKVENTEVFDRPFANYINFYNRLGIPNLYIGDQEHCLMGVREIKGLQFIVLNSAWFARGGGDTQNLWIGQPQLEVLKAKGQLVQKKELDNNPITIAVLHHPKDWLHESERQSYQGRQSSYEMLAKGCHVILSGHVHSETIPEPDKISNNAYLFTGGATYVGNNYRNNFSVFRIDVKDRTILRRGYEYNPAKQEWNWEGDSETPYSLRQSHAITPKNEATRDLKKKFKYSNVVKLVGQSVDQYIEYKAKAVASKTQIVMPQIISRLVAVHNSSEKVNVREETIELNADGNYAPIENVITAGHPAFLFGEVGSGKSTIAGIYVKHIIEKLQGQIPLLIPAGFFLNMNDRLKTLSDYCFLISEYVNEDILLSNEGFDLLEVLTEGHIVTIVIDGFDEIDRDTARTLLKQTEKLVDHWPNLSILVTGRPVELRGLDYSKWQCMSMLPLTTDDQRQILYNEAIACGYSETDARADADQRISFLNINPDLASVAITPLVLRLLREYLTQEQQSFTLGDLLYNILVERLGEWNSKDGKELSLPDFKTIFPTAYSRESLLGKIAAAIYNSSNRAITQEYLYNLISNEVGNVEKKHSVVDQACIFFKTNVLDQNNELLTFPSQPLLECGLGCYIVDRLASRQEISLGIEASRLWREYSFAAAIARRKNLINKLRLEFQGFTLQLAKDKEKLPTAEIAFIVSEAGDSVLASYFLSCLKKAGFRPLMFFRDIRALCMNAYAKCLYLAGNDGFEWFYSQYLDIRYPLTQMDVDVVTDILRNYILATNYRIDKQYQTLLAKMIQPIIASKSVLAEYLLPALVLLIPDHFDVKTRIRLYAMNLNFPIVKEKILQALIDECNLDNKSLVLEVLELMAKSDGNSSFIAAEIWMDVSLAQPPLVIIRKAILAAGIHGNTSLFREVERRIGSEKIENVLRFHALESSNIGLASSLILYKRGERGLYRIGNGLLYGMHDVRKIAESEMFVHELVKANGVSGLHWFLQKFSTFSRYEGIYSAHWRILLKEFHDSELAEPKLLRYATNFLGDFNLTRYPEIRRGFQLLFEDKPEFRAILQAALFSYDRKLRYNAACILFVCYPDSENIAADIIIQNAGQSLSSNYEWIRFCFKLVLGESVTRYISTNLDKYLPAQKTFALALLRHNKQVLAEENYDTLVRGMLADRTLDYSLSTEKGNILDPVLAEEQAFAKLVANIDNQDLTIRRNACSALWDYHRIKLTIEQYAKCLTIVSDDFFTLGARSMYKLFDENKGNSSFVSTVLTVSKSIQALTGDEPLGGLYLQTLNDEAVWKELLWKSFFRGRRASPYDKEVAFLWFLKTGMEHPSIGSKLGGAAKEYMQHPSIIADRQNDKSSWLALLADEFSELSNEEIEEVLIGNTRGNQVINSALISRLGYVPPAFKTIESTRLLFVDSESKDNEAFGFDEIVEIIRDANELPSNYLTAIETTLLSDTLSNSEIGEVGNKSNRGVIFALILSFCRNQPLDYQWIPRSLDYDFGHEAIGTKNSLRCVVRAIAEVVANDYDCKDDYISYIKSVIMHQPNKAGQLWKLLFAAERDSVKIELLPSLIDDLGQRTYKLDYEMVAFIVDYVFSIKDDGDKKIALREFNRLVLLIDSRFEKHESIVDGYACWLFALIVIFLSGETTNTSERLLLYGLQKFYIHQYEINYNRNSDVDFFPARNIINATFPLLEKINPGLITQCWEHGLKSDCPEIQSCCKVLTALPR